MTDLEQADLDAREGDRIFRLLSPLFSILWSRPYRSEYIAIPVASLGWK